MHLSQIVLSVGIVTYAPARSNVVCMLVYTYSTFPATSWPTIVMTEHKVTCLVVANSQLAIPTEHKVTCLVVANSQLAIPEIASRSFSSPWQFPVG